MRVKHDELRDLRFLGIQRAHVCLIELVVDSAVCTILQNVYLQGVGVVCLPCLIKTCIHVISERDWACGSFLFIGTCPAFVEGVAPYPHVSLKWHMPHTPRLRDDEFPPVRHPHSQKSDFTAYFDIWPCFQETVCAPCLTTFLRYPLVAV